MTSPADLCNRALSEIGGRISISSLSDTSVAATQCRLFYEPLRQQLQRTAPWGFNRATAPLTLLGSLNTIPPGAPYPWAFKYGYPADCLKLRYIIPSPPSPTGTNPPDVSTSGVFYYPWCKPSRNWQFIVAANGVGASTTKVILADLDLALAVYNQDITNVELFDSLFTNALVMALAAKLIIPLTGKRDMKADFVKLAEMAITEARAADGNEANPSVDHVPDWIRTRGLGGPFGTGWDAAGGLGSGLGVWTEGWDSMSWGA